MLIELVFKNSKSLYLLKANEVLMPQRPSCLLHRTPRWEEHGQPCSHTYLSLEMVKFGSSSSSYRDMVWSYCGHSFTNILELLCKSKKKEEKNKTKRLFIQLLRKWTLHAAGLLPLLTLASLRGVRALNREVINWWRAGYPDLSHQRSHAASCTTNSCPASPQEQVSPPLFLQNKKQPSL